MTRQLSLADTLSGDYLNIPEKDLEEAESTKDPVVMDTLSGHWDWRIRSRIAKKPNINEKTLESLSKDNDYLVRISVTQNEKVTINILKTMINDQNLLVKKCAKLALTLKQDELYSYWSEK